MVNVIDLAVVTSMGIGVGPMLISKKKGEDPINYLIEAMSSTVSNLIA